MSDVFVVVRHFTFRYANAISLVLDPVYTSYEEAAKDQEQWDKTGGELLPCRLIHVGEQNVDVGLNAEEFLMSLGIVKVEHRVIKKALAIKFVDPDAPAPRFDA